MSELIDTLPLIWAFATLFVVIDPIGLAPIFVALTQGIEPKKRQAIGMRACMIAFVILALFGFFGESVLGFAGISMPAFQIAGGVLLFLTALEMLFELRAKRRSTKGDDVEDDDNDPSVFPLATPLIAGPGAIATVILLTNEAQGNLLQQISVIVVMGAVVLTAFILFMLAGVMERALGQTGILVVSRVLGMLLAALAVQFILNGLLGFSATLS
ncbi:MarC family protein [Planktomarina temperata]|nr:MarC family protein [Planktomarina temperata]